MGQCQTEVALQGVCENGRRQQERWLLWHGIGVSLQSQLSSGMGAEDRSWLDLDGPSLLLPTCALCVH